MEKKNLEKKQYDFSNLNDFFISVETPNQLADSIAQVAFNYAALIDEDSVNSFKEDVDTLRCLYEQMIGIAIKAGKTDVLRG